MARHIGVLVLSLLVGGLGVVACDGSEPTVAPIDGTGPFTGTWRNGSPWSGRGYAVVRDDTMHLIGHRRPDPQVYFDQLVTVELRDDGPGAYSVPEDGGARLWEITGITPGDAGSFPQASGSVLLTSVGDTIVGEVELTADRPDGTTWRFTGGRFRLPVYASFEEAPALMPGPPR